MVEEIAREERKARKSHQCYHCYRAIPRGEVHDVFTGKSDGEIYTLRAHLDCRDASHAYVSEGYASDYWDGVPPLYDKFTDSGEFEGLCEFWRGHFPHVITRFELNEQMAEIRRQERLRTEQ